MQCTLISSSPFYFIFKEKAGGDLLNWFPGPQMGWNPQGENAVIAISMNSSVLIFSDSPKNKTKQKTQTKAFKPSSLHPEQKTWTWEQFTWERIRILAKAELRKHWKGEGRRLAFKAPAGALHSLWVPGFRRNQPPEHIRRTGKVEPGLKLFKEPGMFNLILMGKSL